MIVFQNDDSSAGLEGQDLCRGRNAVADRWYQRDVGGIGIDQPGGGSPRALVLFACERGVECPGCAFASNRSAASFLGSERQRAVGSRIQVANMTRHLEQSALRGKHFESSLCPSRYDLQICRGLPRLENALPDGAAEFLPAQIKVESDRREQNQRRRSRQVETIAGRLAGDFSDDITADEERRQEIEKTGETTAPERLD